MNPPKIAIISLAAVGERAQPLQRTAPSWRVTVQSGSCRRFTDGLLAHVRTPGGPSGPTQPLLRFDRSSPTLCSGSSLIRSNRRGTDPYARWCGRGGAVRRPPIPIFGQSRLDSIVRFPRLYLRSGLAASHHKQTFKLRHCRPCTNIDRRRHMRYKDKVLARFPDARTVILQQGSTPSAEVPRMPPASPT